MPQSITPRKLALNVKITRRGKNSNTPTDLRQVSRQPISGALPPPSSIHHTRLGSFTPDVKLPPPPLYTTPGTHHASTNEHFDFLPFHTVHISKNKAPQDEHVSTSRGRSSKANLPENPAILGYLLHIHIEFASPPPNPLPHFSPSFPPQHIFPPTSLRFSLSRLPGVVVLGPSPALLPPARVSAPASCRVLS